jgi:carbon monoxide dehydrogenase subunit G
MKIESHTGQITENEDKVFAFLSNFNNIEPLVPKESLSSWEFHEEGCKLGIGGIGEIELKIAEKVPFKLIKLVSGQQSSYAFTLWLQLKQVAEKDTRIKLTLEAELNPFLEMMAKKPLQQFADKLVDKISEINFG